MKVLLFGGTFDPIHLGHVKIVESILPACDFDKVIFIQSNSPPHKEGTKATSEDRENMLHFALKDNPLFSYDDIELQRSGPSYSYDTVVGMQEKLGPEADLYWLIGADMLESLPTWYRAQDLVNKVNFIIGLRSPWHERMDAIFESLQDSFPPDIIDGLRDGLIETEMSPISSTTVRDNVSQGKSITDLVHPVVEEYILYHQLYL